MKEVKEQNHFFLTGVWFIFSELMNSQNECEVLAEMETEWKFVYKLEPEWYIGMADIIAGYWLDQYQYRPISKIWLGWDDLH